MSGVVMVAVGIVLIVLALVIVFISQFSYYRTVKKFDKERDLIENEVSDL